MTSKKELRAQLAEAVRVNDRLRASNGEHERRKLSREAREREAKQAERREAEHKARRERLDRLGEGLLPVEGATSRAFIDERNGESGIEVFVPLDAEERRILQGFFDVLDKPKAAAKVVDGGSLIQSIINAQHRAQIRHQYVYGGVPV